jgi:hypothetical protein
MQHLASLRRYVFSITLGLTACATEPAMITVYEDPAHWIALKFDGAAGSGHTHPYSFTPEQISHILRGVTVTPRDTIVGFIAGEVRPAFTGEQIAKLTPQLVQAFKKASAKDVVVFYLLSTDARLGRLVTSGGLAVRGPRLYFILANFMTPPSAGPFEGMAYELDARDEPLLPIARYRFVVDFKPETGIPNHQADRLDPYQANMDTSKRLVIDLTRLKPENSTVQPVGKP